MKLLHSGSVKDAYEINDKEIEFLFTDKISVFDKPIPSLIPDKGESLCRTTTHWFKRAGENGLHTHYLEQTAKNKMRVKKINIYACDKITPTTTNYLIPCEFIVRHYVAGSFYDRVKAGKLDPEKAGFDDASKAVYGAPLPEPYFEMSTKLEPIDRLISTEEALAISKMTLKDLEAIKETILEIDKEINETAAKNGLIHVDGKKEFAMDENRKIMIVDVFGTADEDRFWDAALWEKNEFSELSKEFVRQYYQGTGYKDELYKCRSEGRAEPPIPALPESVIKEASELYVGLFEKITGNKF